MVDGCRRQLKTSPSHTPPTPPLPADPVTSVRTQSWLTYEARGQKMVVFEELAGLIGFMVPRGHIEEPPDPPDASQTSPDPVLDHINPPGPAELLV